MNQDENSNQNGVQLCMGCGVRSTDGSILLPIVFVFEVAHYRRLFGVHLPENDTAILGSNGTHLAIRLKLSASTADGS